MPKVTAAVDQEVVDGSSLTFILKTHLRQYNAPHEVADPLTRRRR